MDVITPLGFRATVSWVNEPYVGVNYGAGSESAVQINVFKIEQLRKIK